MADGARIKRPRNWLAVALSLVTGLGHFYLDHYLTGAVLFGLFVTAINGIFLGSTLQVTAWPGLLKGISIIGFIAVWLFGLWHAYRLSYGTDRPALAKAKDALLRDGIVDYLRDDLEDALHKLERAAALDVDWLDPDPLFHLGVVAVRLAERRDARGDSTGAREARRRAWRAFESSLSRDSRRKWRAEVMDELTRMRRVTSFTGRMRRMGSSIKEVVTTASGLFRRPTAEALAGPPPPKEHDPSPVTQTRKKKRFSAKYEAVKRPHDSDALDAARGGDAGDTRADLKSSTWTHAPSDPAGDTRPAMPRAAIDDPAAASGVIPAPARARSDRHAVRMRPGDLTSSGPLIRLPDRIIEDPPALDAPIVIRWDPEQGPAPASPPEGEASPAEAAPPVAPPAARPDEPAGVDPGTKPEVPGPAEPTPGRSGGDGDGGRDP